MTTMKMKAFAAFASMLTTTAVVALGAPSAQASDIDPVTAELRALSHTQTRSEVNALLEGDAPLTLFVDAKTGDVLSAKPTSTRALNPIGPGCSATSACMTNTSGTPYGLSGTGTRTGSWKKIIRYASGDRRTSFWASNGMAYEYRAGSVIVLNSSVTITKVQR